MDSIFRLLFRHPFRANRDRTRTDCISHLQKIDISVQSRADYAAIAEIILQVNHHFLMDIGQSRPPRYREPNHVLFVSWDTVCDASTDRLPWHFLRARCAGYTAVRPIAAPHAEHGGYDRNATLKVKASQSHSLLQVRAADERGQGLAPMPQGCIRDRLSNELLTALELLADVQ